MSISGHLFRTLPSDCFRTPEEALGCGPVALRTEHRIDQLPLFVNRAIQINPPAAHLEIRFIHKPATTDLTFPSALDLIGQQGSEPCFPVPHRFVTELIAAYEKQVP